MSSHNNSNLRPPNQAPRRHILDQDIPASLSAATAWEYNMTQQLAQLVIRDSNRQPVSSNPSHRVLSFSSNGSSSGNALSSGSAASPRGANSANWRERDNTAAAPSNTSPQRLMPNPSGGGIVYDAGTETQANVSNTAQAAPRVRPQRIRPHHGAAPARSEQHRGHQTGAQASISNLSQVAPHAPLRASASHGQNHGNQARTQAGTSNSTRLAPHTPLRAAPDLRPNHGLQARPSHPVVSIPLAPYRRPMDPQITESGVPPGSFNTHRYMYAPIRGEILEQFQGEPGTVFWAPNDQPAWASFAPMEGPVALNTTTTTTTTNNHQAVPKGSGSTGRGQPTPVNHDHNIMAMPWAGQIMPQGTPAIVRTDPSISGHVAATNMASVPNAPRYPQNEKAPVKSNDSVQATANGGLQVPTNIGLQTPANVGLQAPANGGGLVPGNGGQGPHSSTVFHPMNAVWRTGMDPNHDPQRALKLDAGISLNYAGDASIADNQSADIPDHESCALWVTNLPPNVTYRMLLAAIRGMGRIYCTHINPADPSKGHTTAAAKIVFFELDATHRFLAMASDPNRRFIVGGMVAKVSLNRIKSPARDEGGNLSRVIVITCAWNTIDRQQLENFFGDIFKYNLDKVVHRGYSMEFQEIEFHFGSFRCQAQSAYIALARGGAGRPKNIIWNLRYGVDPCSQN